MTAIGQRRNVNMAEQKDKLVTTIVKDPFCRDSKELHRRIVETRKKMGKKNVARSNKSNEMNFNDVLKITRASTACPRAPPSKKFKIYPTLMPKPELQRLNVASKHITLEQRIEEDNRLEEENKRLEAESIHRKKILKDIDEARAKAKFERENSKEGQKDEKKEETIKVLERAFIAKYEQEEEVKRANRIILNAKCHVVRDAQIHEKYELLKELKDEEIRLDKIMIDEAMKSLQVDDKKFEQGKEVRYRYAAEIKKQLEEREQLRALEVLRLEEESKKTKQAYAVMQQEDQAQIKLKHEKRDKLRNDLNQVYEMTQNFKKMIFDQERAGEIQVQAYMKAKAERESKLEKERNFSKQAIERKRQLLFNNQKKLLEMQSEQGDEKLRRDQEDKEREFRRKEKEAIIKKKLFDKELMKSREAQLNEMKQRQALQMARNEDDFNRTVQILKTEEAKVKKNDEKRARMREKYREEIIGQMNQKEYERREMEKRAKNEFNAWKEKEDLRSQNIRSVIEVKLKELRDTKLPQKYIKDVEKQLKA